MNSARYPVTSVSGIVIHRFRIPAKLLSAFENVKIIAPNSMLLPLAATAIMANGVISNPA